jgi:integrase
MPAITKRTVDDAKPGAKDAFLWDDKLKGFGLKVTPAGAKVYLCQYRTGGRGTPTKRVTIGRHGSPWTPEKARVKAKAILGKVANGGDPAAEKRAEKEVAKRQPIDDGRALEAIAARWFAALRRDGKRSADEVERSFARHVYPELRVRRIETIAKADAHALYEQLADAGHAPMGHQLCRNLKSLLSFAVERELIPVNPLLRIKLPQLESRKRVLIDFHPDREPDPAELLAVWNAADQLSEPKRTYVKVLILTLARVDEVAGMTYAELDGSLWRLPAERHKGKRGYDIPLPTQTLKLIEALPRERDIGKRMVPHELVFTGRGGRPIGDFSQLKANLDARVAIANAQRRMGRLLAEGDEPEAQDHLPVWRLHDLRRSGSSWIEEEFGGEVMHAALGHSLGDRLAKTYARGSGYRRKKRALQAWADFVTGSAIGSKVVPIVGRR